MTRANNADSVQKKKKVHNFYYGLISNKIHKEICFNKT